MQITSDDAVAKTQDQDQSYYFCADRWRVQFEHDPSRYVQRTNAAT